MYDNLVEGALLAFTLYNIGYLFLGVVIGIVFGAIPGFNPSTVMVLLLPFSYFLGDATGLIFLSGIAGAGIFGGSITAILFRAPGTIGSIITAIDGYEMTKRGEGLKALGISTMASALGGFFGGVALLLLAPPLAIFATKISYPETVLIIVWTFLLIAMASTNFLKTMMAATLGLLMASFGADPINGFPRMTFGSFYLYEGINLLTAIVGVFCISELMNLVARPSVVKTEGSVKGGYASAFEGAWLALKSPGIVTRSSAIGTVVGTLPAAGAALANAVAYEIQKRMDRNPKGYGEGKPEGVVAAEAANNATEGSSLIPTMTLGIPGSNIGAVMLAAMILHGMAVGPQIFERNGDVAYALIIAIIIANPIMMVIGLLISKYAAYLTYVKLNTILPVLLILVTVGSFSVRNTTFDLPLLVIFGVLGFFMQRHGYSLIAFVLPFVLGKPLEQAFLISMRYSDNSFAIFTQSAISKGLLGLVALTVAYTIYQKKRAKMNLERNEAAQ
ncbi:tripartite tricarboxylate transporter permease [Epibacterium sp. Ofav1-8]|uniref:tripartite tricarboxylate transporter permease n=1 Tax=Epibacterium sp. Ofav1-8 TaxID=2917735 RepID=UPI001EF62E60|nr:tripartite tricarboxylate transporter permease [Epibacterium sp. Ofav1-8]MCG7626136.1 tripartite tricarboxylate transporter permease [Epibacterium sp. Ofav1-8]